MKHLKTIYKRTAVITGIVLLAVLIFASFADLQISKTLYPGRESSFGQFFAAFGELPAFMLQAACGMLLFRIRKRFLPQLYPLVLAGCFTLVFGSMAMIIYEATDNVSALPTGVAAMVAVVSTVLFGSVMLLLTRGCSSRTMLRFLCTVLFTVVGSMILINIIKVPWGRVRMRLIYATGNESYFTPWWKAGMALKKTLVASGVSTDEFRSFPSGHTCSAASAMLAILFPTVCKRLRGKEVPCFLIGILWPLVVAFSRIQMGAHFLSDVTIGWMIPYVMGILGVRLFYFDKTVFNWFWNLVVANPEEKNEQ